MKCPQCRLSDLVQIRLNVAGEEMTMRSCPSCERRWWEQGTTEVDIDSVISLASTR